MNVLFDESHKPFLRIEFYPKLLSLMEENGFSVDYVSKKPISRETLTDFKVLVLGCPNAKFDDEEIKAILEFISEGGGLLLIEKGRGPVEFINRIGKNFGITFNKDAVTGKNGVDGSPFTPIIKKFEKHPITRGISKIVYGGGCSLSINENVNPLIYSGLEKPLLCALEKGKGRVVAIGTYWIFESTEPHIRKWGVDAEDNAKLILNIFKWLSKAEGFETSTEIFLCPFCNQSSTIFEESTFCPNCGSRIVTCEICQKKALNNYHICSHCGSVFHKEHLLEWMQEYGRHCPNCKQYLDPRQI